jgi:hypothetical protein
MNCQFYDRKDARSTDGRTTMWGQCRRHSPLLNPQNANAKQYIVEGIWPIVRDDDWCGEWFAPAPTAMPRAHGLINGRELMAAAVSASESNGESVFSPGSNGGSLFAPEPTAIEAAAGDD